MEIAARVAETTRPCTSARPSEIRFVRTIAARLTMRVVYVVFSLVRRLIAGSNRRPSIAPGKPALPLISIISLQVLRRAISVRSGTTMVLPGRSSQY